MLNRHTFSTFDHQKVIDLLNLYNMYLPLHYLRRLVYYTPDEDVSNRARFNICCLLDSHLVARQDPFRMSEEKLNRIGVMFLKEGAYREVDGQTYLLDKYGMASSLELEWWQSATGEAEDVVAEDFVRGVVQPDVHPGPQNPSAFKLVFFLKPGSEARLRVYFVVNGFQRELRGQRAPIGLRVGSSC
jgi:hypothetical protein